MVSAHTSNGRSRDRLRRSHAYHFAAGAWGRVLEEDSVWHRRPLEAVLRAGTREGFDSSFFRQSREASQATCSASESGIPRVHLRRPQAEQLVHSYNEHRAPKRSAWTRAAASRSKCFFSTPLGWAASTCRCSGVRLRAASLAKRARPVVAIKKEGEPVG